MRQSQLRTSRRRRSLLVCAALVLPLTSHAFSGKAVMSALASSHLPFHDLNVTVPPRIRYDNAEKDLIKGIKIIESMKTASGCKTQVTRQLLNSCSMLDDAQRTEGTTAEELDKVKSQYAAQLAVCELQEAADPPKLQRCSSLGISDLTGSIDRNRLAFCVKELQSNMVFWGSYTNNLQNVGYMCQVAHAEMEKDELVEQRRASLETTLLVAKALSEFHQSIATQNAELFSDAQNIRDLHRQNVEELLTAHKESSAMLQELRGEFAAQLQKVAVEAQTVVETVSVNAAGTSEEMLRYAQNVQYSLEHIWQIMAEGNAEVAAQQFQDATTNHGLAVAAQQKLENIIMGEIGSLSDGLSGLSGGLMSAGDQVTSMRQDHDSLAQSLDHSIAKSSHLAQTLDELNMPILEMFARAAGFGRFILSDECLMLMGFLSPMAVVFFLAMFFHIRLMFWLTKLGLLLLSSYVISRLYTFRQSSPVLQSIFNGASQAVITSLALVCTYNLFSIVLGAARRFSRRLHSRSSLDPCVDDWEEISRFQKARKTSLQNASKARFERASTSPPC